ncbi:23S rRNA (pseudouridine(1915)-N(3))-methyltransferase RlmH [Rhizobium cremeum]|uniref:23S rRNA (pseudouridine(1915)-N(3))-methyltransferase RlmH n=1 Tax=Rhizobium cremeum TaxID=2813827 RepID=UPI000DDFA39F|nr:23S rRNA (pseudouridine(1915)-N(3))-methyltransferase RlmH [Rhizobium cremeum]MCJ7994453.1 23S rRNA (pseudouridine(1915)-N(3))-methyltransferase RlmH [Rhizobium cremeum]MCJ7999952.1 23S rRNA (pseudouridine(1915)-N(3))-methyltransferase RlmH [Rhizobium cremeum]
MRIGIYAVGRLKSGPEKELASRYLDRFAKAGPPNGLELFRMVELPESRAGNAQTRKREEAAELLKSMPDGVMIVVLDERGKALDSEEFAALLGEHRDRGQRDLAIVIGGADGVDPDLRERAKVVLNLGRLTWPHQLVRILIAEQLYRAVTILSGHPYHRV